MRLCSDAHVHPVPLASQLLASTRARERVVYFALGRVDIVDRRRGTERRLYDVGMSTIDKEENLVNVHRRYTAG